MKHQTVATAVVAASDSSTLLFCSSSRSVVAHCFVSLLHTAVQHLVTRGSGSRRCSSGAATAQSKVVATEQRPRSVYAKRATTHRSFSWLYSGMAFLQPAADRSRFLLKHTCNETFSVFCHLVPALKVDRTRAAEVFAHDMLLTF